VDVFLNTLFGTLLLASGAATIHQLIECRFHTKMRRMRRPFVTGRIQRLSASKLEVKAT
jgi:heme O synthase-like polyprenyltransferase